MRLFLTIACLTFGFVGAGCSATGPSIWEQHLTSGPETAPAIPAQTKVAVRELPWAQMEQTVVNQAAAAQRKTDGKAQLLRGLQVPGDPASVLVVGKSEFKTTDKLATDSVAFHDLARKLGADTVVWSSKVTGKVDKVVQQPVTTVSSPSSSGRPFDANSRSGSLADNRTTYVPVTVKADELAYVVYYLRIQP